MTADVKLDQYQRDREQLERLQVELDVRHVTNQIVVPDEERPFPALNVYHPERTYAVHSVWFYDAGDKLPGSRNEGRETMIPVYVWGGHFEYVEDAAYPDLAADRITRDIRMLDRAE